VDTKDKWYWTTKVLDSNGYDTNKVNDAEYIKDFYYDLKNDLEVCLDIFDDTDEIKINYTNAVKEIETNMGGLL
jgi:hypothetical protein